jgi:hypothetical protein
VKSCNGCAFAEWKRTATGRLHPSGEGRCKKVIKIPELPQAFYWLDAPSLCGGYINRREELKHHCVYFTAAQRTS